MSIAILCYYYFRSISVSTKGHMETNIMVEVWEQLLSGSVGEKTMDTLILSVSYAILMHTEILIMAFRDSLIVPFVFLRTMHLRL